MAPSVDWSQFEPVAQSPAPAAGVDWSEFEPVKPSFRDVESGSASRANFDGVRAGSQSRVESLTPDVPGGDAYGYGGAMQVMAPMSQFAGLDPVGRAGEMASDIGGAATTMEPYGDIGDRRIVGVQEGALRTGASRLAGMFGDALAQVPGPIMAYDAYQHATGGHTLGERLAAVPAVHPDRETFRSPAEEFVGTLGGEGIAAAATWLPAAPEAVAALSGKLGPEVQGAAVADSILANAPKPRVRANAEGELKEVSPEPITPPTETPPALAGASPEQQATQVAADITGAPTEAPARPTLYHASLSPDITEFRHGFEGTQSDPGVLGRGLYFDGNADRAGFYLGPKRKEGTLYGVDAGMENPAVFDSPQAAVEWQGGRGTDSPEAAEAIRQKYLDAGHDGVVIQGPNGDVLHAVSFAPERAKITERRPIGRPAEVSNASEVRSDTGQPAIAREVQAGGRADSGGNVQRAEEAGTGAGDGARPAGTAPNEPVRGEYGAVPGQGPLTSVKNRVVADERSARGMDELDYEGKRAFGDAWDTGRARMAKDESAGQSLAQSVIERPRPLTGEETALLSMERARLNKVHRESMADIAHAMETGDVEAETIARGRLRETEGQLETADRAARASGYEGGFGLASRRMMTKEDYSLAEMLTEAKVRKGQELTPKDRARVESIAARLDGVERELAAVRAQAAKKATRRAPREVHQEYDDLKAQLKAIPKKEHTLCGVA